MEDTRFGAVLECLNSAFQADRQAIASLMSNHVPCNQALADHPHVIVDEMPLLSQPDGTPANQCYWMLHGIGLLNGVLSAMGLPRAAMAFDDQNRFTGFVKYKMPEPGEIEVPISGELDMVLHTTKPKLHTAIRGLTHVLMLVGEHPTPRVRFRFPSVTLTSDCDRLPEGVEGAAVILDGTPADFAIVLPEPN